MSMPPRDMREWMRTMERRVSHATRTGNSSLAADLRTQMGKVRDLTEIVEEGGGQDKRTPTAPIELVSQTALVADRKQLARGVVYLNFPAVTKATDGSEIDVDHYELWGRSLNDWDQESEESKPAWKEASTSTGPSLQDRWYRAGEVIELKARAIGVAMPRPGNFSSVITVQIQEDLVPPPIPTPPVLSVQLGVVGVSYDWLGAGDIAMPEDLDYVEIAYGTPSAPTDIWGTVFARAGTIYISDLPYDQPVRFRLRAVDYSGNTSGWSPTRQKTIKRLVDEESIKAALDEANREISDVAEELSTTRLELDGRLDTAESGLTASQGRLDAAETEINTVLPQKIETASSEALEAAALDAKDKADAAQRAAVEAAAETAQLKADKAKSDALAAAALDATYKAEQAEANAAAAAALDAQGKADAAEAAALQAAKDYADAQASGAGADVLAAAKADAKEKADAAQAAAIAAAALDATAKKEQAEAVAAADAKLKADAAKDGAITAAAADAKIKADAAEAAALAAAKTYAELKASGAGDAALAAAKTDATQKADAAESAAKKAAALDATAKADKAQRDAISAAETKAKQLADAAEAAALAAAKADATRKADAAQAAAEVKAAAAQRTADEARQEASAAIEKIKAQGQNLIADGGFEYGAEGWSLRSTTVVVDDKARNGSHSLRLIPSTGNAYPDGPMAGTTGNRTYYIEAYFMRSGTGRNSGVGFVAQRVTTEGASPVSAFGQIDSSEVSTTEWTKVSALYTAPEPDVKEIGFGPWAVTSDATFWVDDMFAVDVTAAQEALDNAAAAQQDAALALEKAGTALETADSAYDMAGTKTKVFYSFSNPSGTGQLHEVWRKIDSNENVIAEWFYLNDKWNSSQITTEMISNLDVGKLTAGSAVINSLVARKIAASTATFQTVDVGNLYASDATLDNAVVNKLWVDVVKSRKISTDMLLVGSGLNLVANGAGELGEPAGWSENLTYDDTDTPDGIAASFYSPGHIKQGGYNYFKVNPGEEYLFEIWVKADKPNSHLYFELRDQNNDLAVASTSIDHNLGNNPSVSYPIANATVPTVWTKWTAIMTPRTDVEKVRVGGIYFNHTNGTEREAKVHLAGLSIRPRVGTSIIATGSITAPKIVASEELTAKVASFLTVKAGMIEANAVTSDKIEAGAITAVKIDAKAITADKLSADAIDGKTIRGVVVQADELYVGTRTPDNGKVGRGWYFRGSDGYANVYDSSGDQFFSVNPGTKSVNIGGGSLNVSGGRINGAEIIGGRISMVGTGNNVGYYVNVWQDNHGGYISFGTPTGRPGAEDGWSGVIRSETTPDGYRDGTTRLQIKSPTTAAYPQRGYFFVEAWRGDQGPLDQPRCTTNGDLFFTASAAISGYYGLSLDCANTLDLGGFAAIRSMSIRDRPYTYGANVYITSNGYVGKTSSTSADKLCIEPMTDVEDRLLALDAVTWFDRSDSEAMSEFVDAERLGEELKDKFGRAHVDAPDRLRRIPGVTAEGVIAAGLDEFATYDEEGNTNGVMYDRFGVALIPVVRRLRDRVSALEAQDKQKDALLEAMEARLAALESV